MSGVLGLALELPTVGSRQVGRVLHDQLRAAILNGRLAPGVQLPASRALAEDLGLSRNTVMTVYDLLLSEGHIVARAGAGTFVAPGRRHRVLPVAATVPSILYDLRPGLPDSSSFPFDIWGRLTGRALRVFSRASAGYREPVGHPALRDAIAGHLSFARAIACEAEDVVVTVGAQQAFDLLARTLVTRERPIVAVEDPGYPAARAAFAAAGARVCAIPVDREGLRVDELPPEAAVVCVTPSQQFPTGVALSPARRRALLEFAAEKQVAIIEDDYGGEFRFDGPPVDALRSLDRRQRVFYVGTFSKSLLPALRIGFVVAPPWARAALVAARQLSDWHGPAIEHATLATFIAEGHLARHVRRMRTVYAKRRSALRSALQTHCGRLLEPIPAGAGLHLTALLRVPVAAATVAERAARAGVALHSLSEYTVGSSPEGLVLGFGLIEAAHADEAIRRVARAIRSGS